MKLIFTEKILARVIVSFLFVAVFAGSVDVWWHGAFGRDSFWLPPHILLYFSVFVSIAGGIFGYIKFKGVTWKRVFISLLFIIISAPLDEFWHKFFGVEEVASPVIVWSPPHIILILAIVFSFISLLPILKREEDLQARNFFGLLSFSGILSLLLFLTLPIQPTGPYELIGFYGAFFLVLPIVFVFLWAEKWFDYSIGTSASLAIFYLVLASVGYGEVLDPSVKIASHEHMPGWLTIVTFLVPAVFFDLSKGVNNSLRAVIFGAFFSLIAFGISGYFFSPEFKFTLLESFQAFISSALAGLFAFLVFRFLSKRQLSQ